MRSLTIITYFPRHRVSVLGGVFAAAVALGAPVTAHAAPKAAPAKAGAPKPAADAAPAAGPDAATKKAARDAYGAGEKAYGAQDYTTAYAEFKKAHDLIPTIHAEYWMAMAQSYGSDPGAAADALAAVIAAADAPKLGEDKLGSAKARLEELKKMPASVSVTSTPPGAEVSVDGAAQPGVTPTTVSMPAGKHTLAVALKGYEVSSMEVEVKPGEKVEKTAELKAAAPAANEFDYPEETKPAPKPAEPPPEAKEEPSKLPAYITLGVGVVGAGIGTVFGIQALSAKSDFDKNPTNDNADKAERNALIADMSFGIALTLGITGIVLLTTGDSSESPPAAALHHAKPTYKAKLDVAPVMTHTFQGGAARLTF
ncbi:MAG TPA: PEGA domain-containing protein [Polyangiaceae bacterium]|nr:PEGA domain-containing protein [Polyangiaceae bacterium]